MIQINLLPWRERSREIKKKRFFIAMGIAVGFVIFIIFLFHMYFGNVIAYQDSRIAFLEAEISQKQNELNDLRKLQEEQDQIHAKLRFLMGLRTKSYKAVRLLNEILKVTPNTVTLSKVIRVGDSISIEGRAQSDLEITAFMKSIEQSSFFKQPFLTGIKTEANPEIGQERFFQIKVDQRDK